MWFLTFFGLMSLELQFFFYQPPSPLSPDTRRLWSHILGPLGHAAAPKRHQMGVKCQGVVGTCQAGFWPQK